MSSAPAQERSPARPSDEDQFTSERRVYEPHKIGLPPLLPYIRELWRRREFAREMARTELRAQHFNTVFGLLWLVLNPLLLAGVYFVLVDILRSGSRPAGFFAHLMAGIFAYYFIADTLRMSVKSVTGGGRLILNTAFPRVMLPAASVLTAFKRFLPTLLIFIPVYIAVGPTPGFELLFVFPVVALFGLIACGFAMLVAAGQVYFRDLKNFLNYALRIWLYASPILYLATEVPDRYKFLLVVNPIAPLLAAWSDIFDDGIAPSAGDLALGAAWGIVLFVVGSLFFISREREFAVRL
jgi:teichoic acid transport system permease protein